MEVINCLTLKDLVSSRKSKADVITDGRHAHKENIFVDRCRTTPLKNEPMDLSKQRGYTPDRCPHTPIKLTDRLQPEPWTPTANLKMLISAASPDIRDREKKKELFRPIENNEQEETAADSMHFDAVDDGTMDEDEKRPSRKQKSLGLLCQKFLARYPRYPLSTEKTTISLDEVAATLGVERRRIYDIVNVLESLQLVSRVAKNQYCWHGMHGLNKTLKTLQCLGALQKYEEQIAHFQRREVDMEYRFGERKRDGVDSQSMHLLDFADADCHSASANSRKDKSLRIMSQKFVMLFLVSSTNIVSLDTAAKILIEESQDVSDHSKLKTKVRRLYDIANVLTSLGLIKKVHVTEERGRKPAFKWIGPVEFDALCGEQRFQVSPAATFPGAEKELSSHGHEPTNGKQKFSRHASFSAFQRSGVVKRKVNSEPNSPQRDRIGYGEISDDYSSKMEHLAAICRQNMEEKTKSKMLTSENKTNLGEHPGAVAPFSVALPVASGSDYCLKPINSQTFPMAQSDVMSQFSLQNGMLGHAAALCTNEETRKPELLANQPYVCLPSASVFMLYGNLGNGSTLENIPNAQDSLRRDFHGQTTPERSPGTSSAPSPSTLVDEEEPAAKIQKTDMQEDPLSLFIPRYPLLSAELKSPQAASCTPTHHERDQQGEAKCHNPNETDANRPFFNAQDNNLSHMDHSEHAHPKLTYQQENLANIPQYLYLPSAACLNGFNFLISANPNAGAVALSPSQLTSMNVPCVMVPSSSLAQFPFLCSPSAPSQLPTAPCSSTTHAGLMNLNAPGMGSATHLLIGAAQMVTPKATETSSDPQQLSSPVLGGAGGSARMDSPVSRGLSGTMTLLQQSQNPQTPKNVRQAAHETFFKTPGSLGDTIAWRRSEGMLLRNNSSAQRRLQISSGGTE